MRGRSLDLPWICARAAWTRRCHAARDGGGLHLRVLRNDLRTIAQPCALEFAVFVGTSGAGHLVVMHRRFGMRLDVLKAVASGAGPVAACALVIAASVAAPQRVLADGEPEAVSAHERCATRLSVAMLGKSPTAALLASADPQTGLDAMLVDPAFIERFASFTNSQFNPEPGESALTDSAYTLAKFVLTGQKPWKEMFVGAYVVTDTVAPDPNGLGYFTSRNWMMRYAGNETAGYRITSAYRILQNTTGLQLTATTSVDGVDRSATGRQAAACSGCHYSGWFALDKVAKILTRRQGEGPTMTFVAPSEGPQQILDGKAIANERELVTALVDSEDFRFNACRLAFKFLYGREETTCEAPIFDKCVDAFKATGTMQAAITAVAKDPTYCQ
jgi:hypothetical protein